MKAVDRDLTRPQPGRERLVTQDDVQAVADQVGRSLETGDQQQDEVAGQLEVRQPPVAEPATVTSALSRSSRGSARRSAARPLK